MKKRIKKGCRGGLGGLHKRYSDSCLFCRINDRNYQHHHLDYDDD